MAVDPAPDGRQEVESKFLEFYKITLEHREKLISIIMVSGIAVAIPAVVDAYKAGIERDTKVLSLKLEAEVKDKEGILKDKEQELEKLKFRQTSIQSFSSTGLQQDIELRIRLAEYFATLSDAEYQVKWEAYRKELAGKREADKKLLDSLNDQIDEEEIKPQPDALKLRKLYRARGWVEAEFNPVQLSERATLRPGSSVKLPTNEGLNPLSQKELVEIFGLPIKNSEAIGNSCNNDIDNELLKKLLKTEATEIGTITLLEPALNSLKEIIKKIAAKDKRIATEMGTAGGLCVRLNRGTGGTAMPELSRHSYGLAIDISLRGKVPIGESGAKEFESDFAVIAEEFHNAGWLWGGAWTLARDYPHFEVSKETVLLWRAAGRLGPPS